MNQQIWCTESFTTFSSLLISIIGFSFNGYVVLQTIAFIILLEIQRTWSFTNPSNRFGARVLPRLAAPAIAHENVSADW